MNSSITLRENFFYMVHLALAYVSSISLLFRLPITYYRLLKNLILAREEPDNPIVNFNWTYAAAMCWYYRAREAYRRYGLFGYSYEDGLGNSLKDRFFQPYISYGLLFGKLGYRRYVLLSLALFYLTLLAIGACVERLPWTVLVILLTMGSPLLVYSFIHTSKPESLGWALFPLSCFLLIKGHLVATALFLTIHLLLNYTTFAFFGFFLFMYTLVGGISLSALFAVCLPAGALMSWQVLPFLKNVGLAAFSETLGGSGKIKTEIGGLLVLGKRALLLTLIYSLLSFSLVLGEDGVRNAAMTLSLSGLVIVNYKLFRFADGHTLLRAFLALSTLYALLNPNPVYILLYIVLLFVHPHIIEGMAGGLKFSASQARRELQANSQTMPTARFVKESLKDFPYCQPVTLGGEAIAEIKRFYSAVPEGSRLAWETRSTGKDIGGGYRHFNTLLEYLVWDKKLEVLPGEWMRATQTDYFVDHFVKLNERYSLEEVRAVCEALGVSYLLCHTPAFVEMLAGGGYEIVGRLGHEVMQRSCVGEGYTPRKTLFLLRCPFPVSFIEPAVPLRRRPNEMEFEGKGGEVYTIKYSYHPGWRAYCNGQKVKVEKVSCNGLSYLGVRLQRDEKVVLRFEPGLLG